MKQYVLVTDKPWHDNLLESLRSFNGEAWLRITSKEAFTAEALVKLQPHWIFIPHWSHIIPPSVYEKFPCILFHMTDLPYGRGGSPLQNLIVRGHKETKLTALQVSKGIDTGDIYLQKKLSLEGTAEEIFMRSSKLVEEMIREIITTAPTPRKQHGEVTEFKRRKPEDGNIASLDSIEQVYDYIRMLDAPGYPPAFIETANFKIEFNRASLKNDGSIEANVRITKK
jgi:methionyl-tRNA formyltransferase